MEDSREHQYSWRSAGKEVFSSRKLQLNCVSMAPSAGNGRLSLKTPKAHCLPTNEPGIQLNSNGP